MPDTLRLSLALRTFPVELEEADGTVRKYEIRELGGKVRAKWLSTILGNAQVEDGKMVGLSSAEGLQEGLLELCLYDADGDPVPRSKIEKWPGRVLDALSEKAQELNALSDKGVEEAGNA